MTPLDVPRMEALPLVDIVGELQRRLDVLERDLPRLQAERAAIVAMLAAVHDAPTVEEGDDAGPARPQGDPPPDPAPPPPASTPPPADPANPTGDGGLRALAGDAPADVPARPYRQGPRRASSAVVARVLAATPFEWASGVEIGERLDPPVARKTRGFALKQLVEAGNVEVNDAPVSLRRWRRVSIDDASPVAAATDDASGQYQTPALPPPTRPRPRPVPTDRAGHVGAHGVELSARVRREMEREQREAEQRAKEPPVQHDPDSLEGKIMAELVTFARPISELSRRLEESGAVIAMSVRELEREGRIERMQDGKYRRIGG